MKEFGFASLGLTHNDFSDNRQVIQLGYPPDRIDLLTYADGLDFDECYPARRTVIFDDLPIDFIGLSDLKQNKQATGMYQDLADIEALGKLEMPD